MSFMKINQDELLDGFCRGCLKKYEDPGDLLHYTEKNRRLFVYSTGIQVKRNDTFTFQLCKDCYLNMKVSCKFKKQCRTSDRRFKSFLRLKEFGEDPDLITFLKHSDDNLKFPLLSGHSTPANQKIREDDNESTCTSIRNFMTDILQGEEMPDTEARIIKEVIEEEADLLEDSLDSHWLQDDASIDTDFRLDFSFSPFATPHSVNNDHCYNAIKQIEPSLLHKNNHAKRVFQQLPTTHYDNDDNAIKIDEPIKSVLQYDSCKQENQKDRNIEKPIDEELAVKFTADDSITELINQNEGLFSMADANDISLKSIDSNTFALQCGAEGHAFSITENDMAVKSIDLNAIETEFHINKNQLQISENNVVKGVALDAYEIKTKDYSTAFPMTAKDFAVENIDLNAFGDKSNAFPIGEMDLAVKSIESIAFESKSIDDVSNFSMTETDLAVKSIEANTFEIKNGNNNDKLHPETDLVVKNIDLNTFGMENKHEKRIPLSETDLAVKSISLNDFKTESQDTRIIFNRPETDKAVKNIDLNFETNEIKSYNMIENERAVKSITLTENNSVHDNVNLGATGNKSAVKIIKSRTIEVESKTIKNQCLTEENEIAVENIDSNALDTKLDGFSKSENILATESVLEKESQVNNQSVNGNDVVLNNIDLNVMESTPQVFKIKIDMTGNNIAEESENFSMDIRTESHSHENCVNNETINVAEDQNHERNHLCKNTIVENQDKVIQCTVDTIDKAIINDSENELISLEDLLASPTKVYAQTKGVISGASTPTINNILFGENLDSEGDKGHTSPRLESYKTIDDVDTLDDFFKEGVKDFEDKNVDLPLELKYDLKNNYCKLCNKTYDTLKGLKIHLKKIHKVNFPQTKKQRKENYMCRHCGVIIKDVGNYYRHIRIHNKDQNLKLKCELCTLTFSSESRFKMHIKGHKINKEDEEKKPKKYMCSSCGASFAKSSNFTLHQRRHLSVFKCSCDVCGKGFYRNSDLIIHKRSHTGDRPFQCPLCNTSYSVKHSLVQHMKKHIDEKVFQCDYCSIKYRAKSELIKHILHSKRCKQKRKKAKDKTKETPKVLYKCYYCFRNFAKKFTLVKHQSTSACSRLKNEDDAKYFNILHAEEPIKPKTPDHYEEEHPQDVEVLIEQ